jgi:hypothetical protein
MTGPTTATVTPLSEVLGSTPEETAAIKPIIKTFKGVSTKMAFEYRPLTVLELTYNVKNKKHTYKDSEPECIACGAFGPTEDSDPCEIAVKRRCNGCLEFAEHAQVTEADPYYIKYLCTVCRDKASAPPRVKEKREPKMVRYAGFHRSKPSYTADEFETIKKNMEAKIKEIKETNEAATATQPV